MTIKNDDDKKKPSEEQAVKPAPEKKFPKPEIKIIEIDIEHVLFARNTT